MTSIQNNFEWFIKNYDDIYRLCGEYYVVIKDKKIVKIFSTEIQGYYWIKDNNLLGEVSLQYCNGDKSGYTVYW